MHVANGGDLAGGDVVAGRQVLDYVALAGFGVGDVDEVGLRAGR